MSDFKNIEKLLSDIPEKELPKGYDERFYAKMQHEENPVAWLKNIFSFSMPTNLGMVAGLAAVLFVALRISTKTNDQEDEAIAINDEIDLLDDLDVLENWDDKEENV